MIEPENPVTEKDMRDNKFLPTELTIAGLDTADGPEHPCFDGDSNKESVDNGMVQFMVRYGWFGSVVVTTIGATRFVLAGRRRVRALCAANEIRVGAGLDPIRCEVDHRRASGASRDADLFAIVLAENELRRKARSPMAMVRQVVRMLNFGSTLKDISLAMGVTENGVRRWVKVSELAPVVQTAVDAGRITVDAAVLLHGKPVEEQAAILDTLLAQKTATVAAEKAEKVEKAAEKQPPVADRRAQIVAKRKSRKPREEGKPARPPRVSRQDAAGALGKVVKRSGKTLRKLLALPTCALTEREKQVALWAIGDLTDEAIGFFKKTE